MADTWEVEPVRPSFGWLRGLAEGVGRGANSGFGLGDAGSGMAGNGGFAAAGEEIADRLAIGAQSAAISALPGNGEFWDYDPANGLEVKPMGWLVVAVAGIGLWWALK